MAYIVVVITLIILIGLAAQKSTRRSRSPVPATPHTPPKPAPSPKSNIVIKGRLDMPTCRQVKMEVGFVYRLRCYFMKNGSPWVEVEDVGHGFKPSYNVKTSRWKDFCPVIPDFQRELSRTLKEEWESAWADFGRPEFDSERKVSEKKPRPTSVNIEKREVQLAFPVQALQNLPSNISVEGSDGATYIVNLDRLECTCPDFAKRRRQFPAGDVRRVCKHQVALLVKIKYLRLSDDGFPEGYIKAHRYEGKGVYVFSKALEVKILDEVAGPTPFYFFFPEDGSKWADVAFMANSRVERRVYHIEEKRWGQHSNPFPHGTRTICNMCVGKVLS